jgi:hypothetical protein
LAGQIFGDFRAVLAVRVLHACSGRNRESISHRFVAIIALFSLRMYMRLTSSVLNRALRRCRASVKKLQRLNTAPLNHVAAFR